MDDNMKSLSELLAGITPSLDSNGQISRTDAEHLPLTQPVEIVCFDPRNPDQPCPICRGMGVIKYAVEPGDPRFGKLFRCPNHPVEIDTRHQERMRRISNLDAYQQQTFDNFEINVPGYSEREMQSLQTAFTIARDYAGKLDGWLLLEGAYGCGKTHLAAAVGNERLRRGDMVIFMTTPDLLDHLRSTYSTSSEISYDEFFERLRDTPLLILDDLGVENPSEWAQEKLFQLLNHRYAKQRPTVITTNRSLDTLDPRIRSRLMDVNVIRHVMIQAPDYRNAQPDSSVQLLSRLALYSDKTFATFDVENFVTLDEHQRLTKAAETAYRYAHQPEGWLLFNGNFGSGKTHLAAAIANYRRDLGDDVVFLTVPDLLDYLRTAFAPESNVTFDQLFERVRNVELLILDDLGVESVKPWAQEKLFQLLDHRYVGRMATVITTAKKPTEMSPRLLSRLLDTRLCRVVTIDVEGYVLRAKRRS